jgi:hypothetical protein
VIGEVQRLLDERIDVDLLPLAGAASGMREHAGHNAVGAPAVLDEHKRAEVDEVVGMLTGNLEKIASTSHLSASSTAAWRP